MRSARRQAAGQGAGIPVEAHEKRGAQNDPLVEPCLRARVPDDNAGQCGSAWCLCLTLGSQRCLEDVQEVAGESMQEGMRSFGLLLAYELIGTHG